GQLGMAAAGDRDSAYGTVISMAPSHCQSTFVLQSDRVSASRSTCRGGLPWPQTVVADVDLALAGDAVDQGSAACRAAGGRRPPSAVRRPRFRLSAETSCRCRAVSRPNRSLLASSG